MSDSAAVNDAWPAWLAGLSPASQELASGFVRGESTSLPEPQWFLVEVPDDSLPTITPYADFQQLLSRVRELAQEKRKNPVQTFPLYGVRAMVTRPMAGELKYLRHPDGSLHPLFETQQELVLDDSGTLGGEDEDLDEYVALTQSSLRSWRQSQRSGSFAITDSDEAGEEDFEDAGEFDDQDDDEE